MQKRKKKNLQGFISLKSKAKNSSINVFSILCTEYRRNSLEGRFHDWQVENFTDSF